MITVRFTHDAGDDRAGEVKAIDPKRAQTLLRTGYVELVDPSQVTTVAAVETTAQPRAQGRGPRAERRG